MTEVYSFDEAREAWGKLHAGLRKHGMESMAIDTLADHFATPQKWITVSAPPAMDREGVRWRERWYGSEPQKGSAVVDEWGNLIAHLGGDEATHAAVTRLVAAHNVTLSADAIRQGEGKYLVWSNEHRAWWGPDECGYTRIIERAGRYDRDKAFIISSKRGGGWQREENPDEIAIPEADAIAQYVGPLLATPASHASDGGKA